MRHTKAALILVGLLILSGAFFSHIQAKRLINWESTLGTLEYAYIQNRSTPSRGVWGKNVAVLNYYYTVNNQKFSGSRLMMLDFIFTPTEKVKTLKKGSIAVYFDPKNPQRSLLFPDYPGTSISMLGLVGILVLLIGITLQKIVRAIINSVHSI